MQTHYDSDFRSKYLDSLREKADRMTKEKLSQITAGQEGEKPLAAWKAEGMQVQHMPDDEHGILRISVGGGHNIPIKLDYCTIRGSVGQCITLLEKAIAALRKAP